jgi:hypothetical protein
MMKKTAKIWISVISVMFAVGILLPNIPALANKDTTITPTTAKPATLNLTGTIRKLAVEGTCYQLDGDNGQKYELMGKFPKIDGTKVRVSGVVKTDMVTICQVGQPLQVKTVRVIK